MEHRSLTNFLMFRPLLDFSFESLFAHSQHQIHWKEDVRPFIVTSDSGIANSLERLTGIEPSHFPRALASFDLPTFTSTILVLNNSDPLRARE